MMSMVQVRHHTAKPNVVHFLEAQAPVYSGCDPRCQNSFDHGQLLVHVPYLCLYRGGGKAFITSVQGRSTCKRTQQLRRGHTLQAGCICNVLGILQPSSLQDGAKALEMHAYCCTRDNSLLLNRAMHIEGKHEAVMRGCGTTQSDLLALQQCSSLPSSCVAALSARLQMWMVLQVSVLAGPS